MNYDVPKTPLEALLKSGYHGYRVSTLSEKKRLTIAEKHQLTTAKINLAINAAPIVLPIVVNIVSDVVDGIARLLAPKPPQHTRIYIHHHNSLS